MLIREIPAVKHGRAPSTQTANERLLMTALVLLDDYERTARQDAEYFEGDDDKRSAESLAYSKRIAAARETIKVVAYTGDMSFEIEWQSSWNEPD